MLKQVLKTSISGTIKLAHVYVIHWCELHQSLSAAAHVTRQSSTASVCWPYGFSSEQCCVVYQTLYIWHSDLGY